MIENGMLIGNAHDSSANDSIGNCEGCSQEIYMGEEYLILTEITSITQRNVLKSM